VGETSVTPDRGTPPTRRSSRSTSAHDARSSQLEKLHTHAERWEPLIELYLARLDTRKRPREKTDLLRKVAKVFEEKLDDKNQAFDALINALELDFARRDTVRSTSSAWRRRPNAGPS
jgi:golgin subfamily B member 1